MSSLCIHVLNVGQGDCIVLEYTENEDKKIWGVVDCFESGDNTKTSPLKFLKDKKRKVKKLTFVCLTHPDKNHYIGMLEILKYFNEEDRETDEFWDFGLDKEKLELLIGQSKDKESSAELLLLYGFVNEKKPTREMEYRICVREWQHSIQIRNNENFVADVTTSQDLNVSNSLALRPIRIRALSPIPVDIRTYFSSSTKKPKKHQLCVVLVVMFGDKNILLAADAVNWLKILEDWNQYCKAEKINEKFDFIKVSHHGSKHGNYERLWKRFTKKEKTVAIISSGCKRKMPHPDTLEDILLSKVKLYSTNLWDFSKIVSGNSAQEFRRSGCITPKMLERLRDVFSPKRKKRLKDCADYCRHHLQEFLKEGRISQAYFKGLTNLLDEQIKTPSPYSPRYHGNCSITFSDGSDCKVVTQSRKPHISFCDE